VRIAFLTPEFSSELRDAGGLASYLDRTAQALRALGHEPEIFTAAQASGVIDWRGLRVERVPVAPQGGALARGLARLGLGRSGADLRSARALAAALERRHRERPFAAVQSANYRVPGFWLAARRGRPHALRLSSLAPIWTRERGRRPTRADAAEAWLERRALRRADLLYAPSAWLASRAADALGRPVPVIRPPFFLDHEPDKAAAAGLPRRFLLHAGKPGRIKGSDRLAAALPRAWEREPELALVICGRPSPALARRCAELWGSRAAQVRWLPPQPRPQLLGILAAASALVAVSRADNLPNLALEALALDVPLVAHRGASFDELVRDGENGRLVDADDAPALAAALLEAWRGQGPFAGGRLPRGPIWDELAPEPAARRLLRLLETGA